jgi:hypothetical protein
MKKEKMTGWYDPGQLARTGVQVAISTIFGRHADRRQLQGLAKEGEPPAKPFYDAPPPAGPNGEFWFDYIADVGDGFNPTYTMACCITEPELTLNGEQTQQGQLLVFGGDEVYPLASQENYKQRLIDPYAAAFSKPRAGQEVPEVYAVPGNHDWYDSLAEFGFNFMEDHFGRTRQFCGWKSSQERSYFAIKLPAGWWLFGTDMQLGSALDNRQMKYFQNVVSQMGPNDRIILCNAEPHWITASLYPDDPEYDNRNMGFFEGHILKHKVAVHIAGDRHYYRRHEEITDTNGKPIPPDSTSKIQKITAGGGGAFLHPTHNETGVEKVGRRHKYELRKSFPEASESWRLGLKNFLFPFMNPKFGIVTAIVYVLTAWAFIAPIGQYGLSDFTTALKVVLHRTVEQPIAFLWMALIFAGFLFFTDTHSKAYRLIAGPIHGLAHLAGVFFVSWGVSHWIDPTRGHSPLDWTLWQVIVGVLAIALGGYIVGPLIMGIYLFISLNIFKRHHNESFSSIKVEDYKNFVRFKIEPNGDLLIYPVGVKKVIKKWRDGSKGERPVMPVEVKEENKPFLIEGPIRYVKPVVAAPPPTAPGDDA